jgi:GDP-4-dehydro-6-deoxy-D-mannose reductase
VDTFKTNVFSGINLLESLRTLSQETSMLAVCTAEIYGEITEGEAIKESYRIYPENPYAVSKAAIDFLASIYQKAYGLKVMITRSFNHIGPGQSEGFVCSDFARQVALIETGKQDPVIMVGNLDSSRDFLDVRDVAKAYWHIMNKGKPGQAYNVCSGNPVKISSLLEMLIALSTREDIEIKLDKDKFRPIDIPTVFGDNTRLVTETGWQPQYTLEDSLGDILDWWREKINTGKGKKS